MISRPLWWQAPAVFAALVLWAGCPEVVVQLSPTDDDDDDVTVGDDDDSAHGDLDGDGHSVADGDCDDHDASVYPGATEICDDLDHDCDGEVHDDADADGADVCDDCDDSDAQTHPGAEEICDGVDNDCDGDLPEDEADGDSDGYPSCAGDCDDGDPLVSPGAAEIPYDGIDNNCSEGDFTDVDLDGHDWEGMDGGDDCDDNDPDVYPGADETNGDGVDSNCDGLDDIPLGSYCYSDDNTLTVPGWGQYTLSSWSDADDGPAGQDHYYDDIEFEVEAGWVLTMTMLDEAWSLDPYLYLLDTTCQVIAENDNDGGHDEDDASITFEFTTAGVYTLVASTAGPMEYGTYEIWIN